MHIHSPIRQCIIEAVFSIFKHTKEEYTIDAKVHFVLESSLLHNQEARGLGRSPDRGYCKFFRVLLSLSRLIPE
jgi:hypothetical protein